MTRNVLPIEAVGRRANNVLLPHSIQAWDNDCWSNKVIEEQLDQRHIPPQSLTSIAWVVGLASSQISDVAFPEEYVTENFQEIFRKISGNFLLNRKNLFIHNVSMKTSESTGKLLHSFKS